MKIKVSIMALLLLYYNNKRKQSEVLWKKNNNWYDYPQEIKNWKYNIDNIMFIDENGSEGKVKDVLKKLLTI